MRLGEEEIESANNSSLIEIARNIGIEVKKEGKEWRGVKEKGLWINEEKGKWNNFKSGKGGGAVQFVMEYEGLGWRESIIKLNEGKMKVNSEIVKKRVDKEEEEKVKIIVPRKADTNERLFAFLVKKRGIEEEVVRKFIEEKSIYQDERGNVAFIGRNNKNEIRYCSIVSTVGKFRQDIKSSEKKYSFRKENKESKKVYIFESPIDMMSYISLKNMEDNYISLGGVSIKGVDEFIKENEHIEEIICCTDNDIAGEECYKRIEEKYEGKKVRRDKPKNKDFNDDLRELKKSMEEDKNLKKRGRKR